MPFGQVCYEDPVTGDTTCDSGGTSTTTLNFGWPVTTTSSSQAPQPVSTTASKGQSPLYSIIAGGVTGAAQILGQRYAVPQLQPGQYIQRTPQGSVMFQLPTGGTGVGAPSLFPTTGLTSGGGGTSSLLLIGGVILGAVLLFGRKG